MRVVIGEDSALFREGLAALLRDAGHDVVAAVGDAAALVEAVAREHRRTSRSSTSGCRPLTSDDGARAARDPAATTPASA